MGNNATIKLSIIIVTWNNQSIIRQCLQSVYHSIQNVAFEVIVVDNQSSDNTCSIIQSRFPQVNLVVSERNLGFAGGNNLGYSHAKGEYILLLNPDAFLDYGWPEDLLDNLYANPQIGVLGANLRHEGGGVGQSYGSTSLGSVISGDFRFLRPFYKKCRHIYDPVYQLYSVDYVVGAFLLTRKTVIDQIGFLDQSFFAYYEETDFCRRVKQSGYDVVMKEDFWVTHIGGKSFDQWGERVKILYDKSKLTYINKHYGQLVVHSYVMALLTNFSIKFAFYWLISHLMPLEVLKKRSEKKFSRLKILQAAMKNDLIT